MNGSANCILEICCLPDAAEKSLSLELQEHAKCPPEYADAAAAHIKKHYDLAPPGSLKELFKEVARLAREGYVVQP